MPTLDWMGKDKVVNHHRDVPFHVLERVPDKGVLDDIGSDCGNMVIHGDNLEALKALLPEYEGCVDVIYIDPPYNTGNEGWVYNDNVNDPRIRRWLGQVVGKEGEDFTRHDKWLCMMYPRLVLLRKLLASKGVIFISIDDNEVTSLRSVCDEIFGAGCFAAIISWQRTLTKRNDAKSVPAETEHLLVYSKSPRWIPHKLDRTQGMDDGYSNPDGDERLWTSVTCSAPGAATHQGMVYAIQHPITGSLMYPPNGRCWSLGQDRMLSEMSKWAEYELRDIEDEAERKSVCVGAEVDPCLPAIMLIDDSEEALRRTKTRYDRGLTGEEPWPTFFFTSKGVGGMRAKKYLDESTGRVVTNFWPASEVGTTDGAKKLLANIFGGTSPFDTPKPPELIERCIQLCSGSDALVLDSFAGSGTTAHAVLNMNQKDGGTRRFILCEMMSYADSITAERVRRVIRGYETKKNVKTALYEQKLTFSNLKNAEKYREKAVAAAEEAKQSGAYSKVEGPKVDGGAITVMGVTAKGEQVPGTGGGFSYYELGPALFDVEGGVAEDVSVRDLMRYVWYTETKAPYVDRTGEHPYLMGEVDGTAYYLAYRAGVDVTLGYDLLAELPVRGNPTVIYASRCVLPAEELERLGIRFRRVPDQIARM